MSKVTVVLQKDPTAVLAPGAAPYANTVITLTDSTGAVQTATVTGTELPAWTAEFDSVAAGGGSVAAQDNDTAGAGIGAPVIQTFTDGGTGGSTFPKTTGITVTVA